MTTSAKQQRSRISNVLKQVVTDIHFTNALETMNNPWTNAYNHPNFAGYNKEQIDEMLICELQEIYNYE
tara:strand:+ start:48 stop:254 length:207 start_codon:yes stop_codon:yes gene_type:complete